MLIDFGQVITAEDKAGAGDQAAAVRARDAATAYLAATDWLEICASEGGPAVPKAVQTLRQLAREKADA